MSYLEAVVIYFVLLAPTVFLAINSLFFYREYYNIDKSTLVKFFNSFLVFSIISKVVYVSETISCIYEWLSKQYGIGKERRFWLFFNILFMSVLAFFGIKHSISHGAIERFIATILFLIAMIPTIFVAYRFGSKLKEFEDK